MFNVYIYMLSQLRWRLSDEPLEDGESEDDIPVDRKKVKCTIFLGYTSNMISSGIREIICYLAKYKMVSFTACYISFSIYDDNHKSGPPS